MNLTQRIVLLVMTAGLAACGYNVKAIKSFEESSSSLTKDYEAMVTQTDKWCWEAHRYYRISSPQYTDQDGLEAYVNSKCQQYSEKLKGALVSKAVVNAYAQALATVVGVSPQYLNDDLSKMSEVVGKLKRGDGTALMTDKEVSLTLKLAQFLSEIYISHEVKEKTVSIIQENKDLVNRHIDIMNAFSGSVYGSEKDNMREGYEAIIGDLLVASKDQSGGTQEMPVVPRMMLNDMTKAQAGLKIKDGEKDEVQDSIDKFKVAAEAMKVANNELEEKFRTLPKDEQLKSIIDFSKKVKELNDAVDKLSE